MVAVVDRRNVLADLFKANGRLEITEEMWLPWELPGTRSAGPRLRVALRRLPTGRLAHHSPPLLSTLVCAYEYQGGSHGSQQSPR